MYDNEDTLTRARPLTSGGALRRVVPPGQFFSLGDFDVPGVPPARSVCVYVPSDHVRDGTRPALYLFDGQNVFDDSYSFAGGWFVHDAVDSIGRRGRNIPVVVGIAHGGDNRMNELVPWKIKQGGGSLEPFLDWMTATLIPRVQREFGLRTGPLASVIGGSSLGGLAALYAHYRNPETFGGALSLSPSLWVAKLGILSYLRDRPKPHFSRIYLDCGGQEGGGKMIEIAERLARQLRDRGYDEQQLLWRPDPSAGHNERSWRRRLPKALRFMFSA